MRLGELEELPNMTSAQNGGEGVKKYPNLQTNMHTCSGGWGRKSQIYVDVVYGRPLVVRGEGDELGEGGCQVDGHQDHRVQACDPAAEARPGNSHLHSAYTLRGVHSVVKFCFIFFWKFRYAIGLHSSCSITAQWPV